MIGSVVVVVNVKFGNERKDPSWLAVGTIMVLIRKKEEKSATKWYLRR